jgi:hypothetical protein
MHAKAAITVLGDPAAVQQAWERSEHRIQEAPVEFKPAPGDRGTEIHVQLGRNPVQQLTGVTGRAKIMDSLRRFKALLETGEVPRSDAVPEGELAERMLKQRPAQPLGAGV